MTRGGRVKLVQFVMTVTIIYHAMVLDLPAWAIKAADKYRQNSYGMAARRRMEVSISLCGPNAQGRRSLGVSVSRTSRILEERSKVRWAWLRKTESDKPWALLSMALTTEIRNGRNTLFWQERWILGQRLEDLCPLIYGLIPNRAKKREDGSGGFH